MLRLARDPRIRAAAALLVAVVLVVAVVLRRQTIFDAIAEVRRLPLTTVAVLVGLAVVERVSRAEVIRSLLPSLSLTRSEMISDVGSAASKGVPVGGPIATLLRWQLARERNVRAPDFVVMLVASGVATAFVSWGFPLIATIVDISRRDADVADLLIIAGCCIVVGGSALFWSIALRSERARRYVASRGDWMLTRWPVALLGDGQDEAATSARVVDEIRDGLRAMARRPVGLLVRTVVAQGTGAVILWVALRGLGVGDELGPTEFARVFFVAHVIGSLAPTPGGVGVIEAGVTGALIAAGVETELALAGVLVYRFITYVLPIVIGTVWYIAWRSARTRDRSDRSNGAAGAADDDDADDVDESDRLGAVVGRRPPQRLAFDRPGE